MVGDQARNDWSGDGVILGFGKNRWLETWGESQLRLTESFWMHRRFGREVGDVDHGGLDWGFFS